MSTSRLVQDGKPRPPEFQIIVNGTLVDLTDTPEKIPAAPHPSPLNFDATDSKLSTSTDDFTAALMQACLTKLPIDESYDGHHSECSSNDSQRAFNFVLQDLSTSFDERLSRNLLLRTTLKGKMDCSSYLSVESVGDNQRKSPISDEVSMIANYGASDVSDLSDDEVEMSVFEDDLADDMSPGYLVSPRRPRSAVGQLLFWKDCMKPYKRTSSLDGINYPVLIGDGQLLSCG